MIGAILAAGRGTRMQPFSTRYPKPILPIGNKPLLQHQIELAQAIGIDRFLIVIGHLGYEIAQQLGDGSKLGVKIRYVEQNQSLGIAHALGQLESQINEPVLLFLGDVFFVADQLNRMARTLHDKKASAVLATKEEQDPRAIRRNFTVLTNPDGTVRRLIEKPRHSSTKVKGCGLYLFDQQVFDAIRRTPRTAMRDEYEITDAIQIMVDDGLPVYCEEVIQWDINLTFPHDVLRSNLFQLTREGREFLLGDDVRIHPGADVQRSVIGDRVVIEQPIRVRDSVLFADVVVSSAQDLRRVVLTPDHCIDCRHAIEEEIDVP
jgi:NDP-sugar pyrophosphorylase family protein